MRNVRAIDLDIETIQDDYEKELKRQNKVNPISYLDLYRAMVIAIVFLFGLMIAMILCQKKELIFLAVAAILILLPFFFRMDRCLSGKIEKRDFDILNEVIRRDVFGGKEKISSAEKIGFIYVFKNKYEKRKYEKRFLYFFIRFCKEGVYLIMFLWANSIMNSFSSMEYENVFLKSLAFIAVIIAQILGNSSVVREFFDSCFTPFFYSLVTIRYKHHVLESLITDTDD